MTHMPFRNSASNENRIGDQQLTDGSSDCDPPWELIKPSEPTPIMFQLQRANGNIFSYAYCDLREMRLLSAGYLQLFIYGMEKYLISIQGRHLTEFAKLMGMCRVKSFEELGKRTYGLPETSPSIDLVTIEELTGPAPH